MTNPRSFTVLFQPSGRRAAFDEPLTILDAARQAGVEIAAPCGGQGLCGRCRVRLDGDGLSPPSDREQEALSAAELARGLRLACQTMVEADAGVYVPEMSRPRAQQLQLTGRTNHVAPNPGVHKILVELDEPTLSDPRADLDRLDDALASLGEFPLGKIESALFGRIGPALREADWTATLSLTGGDLIHVEAGDATDALHGIAVDLGSTKIAAYLVNLKTGVRLDAKGTMNPQMAYGEDIASRLSYAAKQADGARTLQRLAVEALSDLIRLLCDENGLTPEQVLKVVVVGNTAMHHLFLGLSTTSLTAAPFVPVAARPLGVRARDLGLPTAPGAIVSFPAPIAGFVGSDHLAMILASGLHVRRGAYLGIDIGTNTEICLSVGGGMTAVSCASGPAFEGASVCWGMRAAPGAIERIWIDPNTQAVRISTVGNVEPVGICGSGILDCVAGMVGAGIVNAQGHIQRDARGVRAAEDGLPELVIAETPKGESITVAQQDVGQIQVAKAAIRSGIDVLLDSSGITAADLDGIILAGAFGTFIDPLSAMEVGMLPEVEPEIISQVGNAAGVGATEMLISTERSLEALDVARQLDYLELTVYPNYSRFFARALRF